jgi:hypothetical protein
MVKQGSGKLKKIKMYMIQGNAGLSASWFGKINLQKINNISIHNRTKGQPAL